MSKFQIGQIVVSGNTFAPTRSKIVAIRTWNELHANDQARLRQVYVNSTEAQLAALQYVVAYNGKSHPKCRYTILSVQTFDATHYASNADMIAAYAAKAAV